MLETEQPISEKGAESQKYFRTQKEQFESI
jgi:hypothetical protein